METGQVTWETTDDNIARIDGARITGLNLGETHIRGRHRHRDVNLHIRVMEKLYIADAIHTATENFAFGPDGRLYFILRNSGPGSVFLHSLGPRNPVGPAIHTELPAGSAFIALSDDGVVYIGNVNIGIISSIRRTVCETLRGLWETGALLTGHQRQRGSYRTH